MKVQIIQLRGIYVYYEVTLGVLVRDKEFRDV